MPTLKKSISVSLPRHRDHGIVQNFSHTLWISLSRQARLLAAALARDFIDRSWLQGECLVYRFHADKEIDAPFGWREIETEETSPTVSLMRDALLLYRVSLRRLKAFAPSAALDEMIDLADRIFFASAMASKKNPYERSLAAMWRKDIICAEQKFREKGSCRTH